VPRPDRRLGHDHQRAVDQARQQVENLVGREIIVGTHRLGGLQRAAVRVHRKPPQDEPLGLAEQLPAPVDHRAESLLAGWCAPVPAGQYPESVVDPGQQTADSQRADPGGGQLQCQRDAVEPMAQLGDLPGVRLVEREPGRGGSRPGDEEPDRARLGEQHRVADLGIRQGQWRYGADLLAGDAQRLLTAGQQADARRVSQDPVGQLGDGFDDVFAVVQEQQELATAQRRQQPFGRRGRRALRVLADAQHREDRPGEGRRVGFQGREFDQPHPVRVRPGYLVSRLDRQSGLAHSAGAHQGYQPAGVE